MRIRGSKPKQNTDWVLQFINIVFLILTFFLVVGTISGEQPPGMEIPVSTLSEGAAPPAGSLFIDVTGRMMHDGGPVKLEKLSEVLSRSDGTVASAPLTIVADKRLPADTLVQILEALEKSGVGQISIITAREDTR
jgi:biopolymer transport protein ExbD